jgi:hypothetical protein
VEDNGGPVLGVGEPVQLAEAAAEDEAHRHAAGHRAHDKQPQGFGEQGGFQRGQAHQQQRQPRADAAAAGKAGRYRLAGRGTGSVPPSISSSTLP